MSCCKVSDSCIQLLMCGERMKTTSVQRFPKMAKIVLRAVIKYFVLKDLTLPEIKDELDSSLKDSFPSFSTEFKRRRTSIQDNKCSECPKPLRPMKLTQKSTLLCEMIAD